MLDKLEYGRQDSNLYRITSVTKFYLAASKAAVYANFTTPVVLVVGAIRRARPGKQDLLMALLGRPTSPRLA